jgi:chromosome segregation ATPase
VAAEAETAAIVPEPDDERALAVARAREADLERRIDALQDALLKAETRAGALKGDLAQAERDRAELEQRLAAAEERLRAAEEWIRTIHASKSWRLTEPLRRLAAALRARS